MPRQPLNIVVLGGSFAGLAVAHNFLDYTIHKLGTFEDAPTYRIVLISPSTHLFWNICAPRALVSSSLIHTEDAFIPIEASFVRHPFNEFTFIQGWATGVDTSAKQVSVELVGNASAKRLSALSSKGSTTSAAGGSVSSPVTRDMNYRTKNADRNSKSQTIQYHALIIASGSSAYSPLYSLHGTHGETLAELKAFHRKLETARSVMVVGGGPSGVETAGQLAIHYNRRRKLRELKEKRPKREPVNDSNTLSRAYNVLFTQVTKKAKEKEKRTSDVPATPISPRERQLERNTKRDSGISGQLSNSATSAPSIHVSPPSPSPRLTKTITLLSGSDSLLPKLSPKVGKKAEKKLKKLGVHVVHNLREISHNTNSDGTTNCVLNNDMTITSDILISATGVYPNTRFLPQSMLDENGYIKTDTSSLRVHGHWINERVYAIGDCASYSKNYTLDVYDALPVVMKNLHNDLLTYEYRLQTVTSIPVADESMRVSSAFGPKGSLDDGSFVGPSANKAKWPDSVERIGPKGQAHPPSPTFPATPEPKHVRGDFTSPAPAPTPPQSKPTSPTSVTSPTSDNSSSAPTSQPIPKRPLLTSDEARRKIAALEDAHYQQVASDSQLMPITRFGGVGVIFDFRVPSFGVYLLKGRKYKLGRAKDAVGKGRNPYGK